MLKGAPQSLTSHFRLSYHLLLELIQQGKAPSSFSRKSLIQEDVERQIVGIKRDIVNVQSEIDRFEESIKHIRTPIVTVRDYITLNENRPFSVNKKRKDIDRQIQTIKDEHKYVDADMNTVNVYDEKRRLLAEKGAELENAEQHVNVSIDSTIQLLEKRGFLKEGVITAKGEYASVLKEVHCLVFSDLLVVSYFDDKSIEQLVEIFSCFTNITVNEDYRETMTPASMKPIVIMYQDCFQEECSIGIHGGIEYEIQYDLFHYMAEWCRGECVEDCKWVLQKMLAEKGIFLGEFVKALLKINNIAAEIASIAEKMGNMNLLALLKSIPDKILKYVVTNQSLYV
jgi:superfamily II RNA helicase